MGSPIVSDVIILLFYFCVLALAHAAPTDLTKPLWAQQIARSPGTGMNSKNENLDFSKSAQLPVLPRWSTTVCHYRFLLFRMLRGRLLHEATAYYVRRLCLHHCPHSHLYRHRIREEVSCLAATQVPLRRQEL
ncbi:hypothetical protein PMAYCL1PPCAC_33352, partial [Pristionchus mayeri]